MISIIIVGYNPDIIKLNKFLKVIDKKITVIYINNSENYNLKKIKFNFLFFKNISTRTT